jgi:hypothetical protein
MDSAHKSVVAEKLAILTDRSKMDEAGPLVMAEPPTWLKHRRLPQRQNHT